MLKILVSMAALVSAVPLSKAKQSSPDVYVPAPACDCQKIPHMYNMEKTCPCPQEDGTPEVQYIDQHVAGATQRTQQICEYAQITPSRCTAIYDQEVCANTQTCAETRAFCSEDGKGNDDGKGEGFFMCAACSDISMATKDDLSYASCTKSSKCGAGSSIDHAGRTIYQCLSCASLPEAMCPGFRGCSWDPSGDGSCYSSK